jgi:hypothetical protein
VQVSPFASAKTAPRRPVGTDLRGITRQALLVFSLAPAVVAALALASHPHPDFGSGVWLGVLIASIGIGLGWARSIAFESRHPDESADFWLAREAVVRPRAFFTCLVLTGLGLLMLVAALVSGRPFLAGLCIAPTYTATAIVLLMWGKVP